MKITKAQLEACRHMVNVPQGNEAAVRGQFLTRLFEVLPERSGDWRGAFIAGSEYLVQLGLTVDGSGQGRIDTYYSNRVIEYEPDLRRKLREAEAQLCTYAAALWTRFGPELGDLVLVATDVRSWRFYLASPPNAERGGRVAPDAVVMDLDDEWSCPDPTDAEIEHLVHMLDRFLFGGVHPMTPEVLVRHFGLESELGQRTVAEITEITARSAESDPIVHRAIGQWQHAQRSIMPDAPQMELYAQHVYLVILTRLLAAEMLRRPDDEGRAAQLPLVLSGMLFQQRARVTNFVDRDDAFAWIGVDPHAATFLNILNRLSAELAQFDPRAPGFLSVLSAIFDHFMPGEHRNLLGQRGTPDRLAESVVEAVLEGDVERPLLDPFCGDGRFVQAGLRMKINAYSERMEPPEVAERVAQEVMAADIDPVAVALTRLIYVLTAAEVLRHAPVPLALPVYQADVVFGELGELPQALQTPRFALAMNPPWIAMSREPGIPYREQLKRHAHAYGIEPTGSSRHHVELATVAVLHTARRFLSEGARLGAILPRAIWDGDNHAGFREQEYTRTIPLQPLEFWDLKGVDNLFAVPSFVWFARRTRGYHADPDRPLRARFWTGLRATQGDLYGEVSLRRLGEKSAWTVVAGGAIDVRDHDHYPAQFAQGADLMPRAALFVERLDSADAGHRVLAVQTSAYERSNRTAKLFRGRAFTGMVEAGFLFPAITSACLLPLRILPPLLAALPVRRNADGAMESVDAAAMDEFSRRYFDEVDRALAAEQGANAKPIRDRIDFRNKLRMQQQPNLHVARFVVLSGMGGAHPCAGVLHLAPGAPAPIFDQTVYYAYLSSVDEAYYLAGMLNSHPLEAAISAFQSTGLFGRRHVHELAYRPIPPFRPNDADHEDVATIARRLERQIAEDLPRQLEKAVCAHEGTLAQRRRGVRGQFTDGWSRLNDAAARILQPEYE